MSLSKLKPFQQKIAISLQAIADRNYRNNTKHDNNDVFYYNVDIQYHSG